MRFRTHVLDGAVLFFDRGSGWNLHLEGPRYQHLERRAPRVVHLGLTNHCNLRCAFCFRDRKLGSGWTAPEVLAWARDFAEAGVLELAFGQGEPLVFRGFPTLVRALHVETPLSVSFTTNGLLLTPEVLDSLGDAYGQIRLSFYEDNAPLERARMLAERGARFGVNLLVTPARLATLRETLEQLVEAGCRDVLLLSYNGADAALHLSYEEDRRLASLLLEAHARYGEDLALKLSVCFGRRLFEVPRLLMPSDCGAGDEFIALDSAKRLLACSFHAEAAPVSSAAEALHHWRLLRQRRAHAGLRGCTRDADARAPSRVSLAEHPLRAWRGWASNHSTSYTLVGEFPSPAKATAYVEELDRLLSRCEGLWPEESSPEPTFWELLGKRGEPPHPEWTRQPSDVWRPDIIAVAGRRVFVDDDSTLKVPRVAAQLLLLRHGRMLLHGTDAGWLRVVLGAETGGQKPTFKPRVQRPLIEEAIVGSRWYGICSRYDFPSVVSRLRGTPWSFAVVPEFSESLEEALANPLLPSPRKRHVEWLMLEGVSLNQWRTLLARLSPDVTRALAEEGWTAPFRWPQKLEAHAFLGGVVVRSEGAPIPAALQFFLSQYLPRATLRVVDREALRIQVSLRGGSESPTPLLKRLLEQPVPEVLGPDWGADIDKHHSTLWLTPREPVSGLVRVHALFKRKARRETLILPVRPVADALGRIQADLDAGLEARVFS